MLSKFIVDRQEERSDGWRELPYIPRIVALELHTGI